MKSIKEWPETERPRERLIKEGVHSLSDAQLLAIILRTGSNKKTVLETAIELLNRFGGLKGIEGASTKELQSVSGLGIAKIAQIKASFELGKRALSQPEEEKKFNSASIVYNYLYPKLDGLKKEVFVSLLLDAKLKLIKEVKVSEGILTQTLIHPREIFREAVKESAYALILVHNHPSGDPTPSEEDIEISKRLKEASQILEISLLDHVIIGKGRYFSMKEKNII
ncbi:MAG: DNA repair protein RadC [Thermodesulfovibrio sp.]|jgi:DNA repair protein RadC|uniref:RadC family protein n=1 Tax=unclassified Thermodesulfovibrio TaxID=2645936 RepID=UPI00083AEDD9|nr:MULTISPECIES: DNA repair protein RadC [unclassified Thermodesulfovibrio]MDI1471700.1 DNA repair protein RadC [Thermodesulfovibrio sp. 1176]MDI6713591.1 DNA repair protein RadC [Thermodesulfovibrio sp.]ODA44273.1 DNA repair protein RadC [Thermodesulfovibrio sp. N1]